MFISQKIQQNLTGSVDTCKFNRLKLFFQIKRILITKYILFLGLLLIYVVFYFIYIGGIL